MIDNKGDQDVDIEINKNMNCEVNNKEFFDDFNEKDFNQQKFELSEINEAKESEENGKKNFWNFLFIIVTFIGLIIYIVVVDGIDNIINIFKTIDYKWVFMGFVCLFIFWMAEAVNLHIPVKKMYPNHKFKDSFRISMIGLLFNNITPFASGGQPMQAYELSKKGERLSDSFSCLVMKFIVSQIALVISTIVIAFTQIEFITTLMKDYLWLIVIGLLVNLVAVVFAILAGTNRKFVEKIMMPIIRFLGKIHIVKDVKKKQEKMVGSIENFANQFSKIKTEKVMVFKMFIVATIQALSYYSITYMVYRAFGNSDITFWQIIPVQAILLLIMMFIPTPGSGLGAEGGFYLIFNKIFQEGTINMSILFWRIYTFYLPIIVGLVLLLPKFEGKKKKY